MISLDPLNFFGFFSPEDGPTWAPGPDSRAGRCGPGSGFGSRRPEECRATPEHPGRRSACPPDHQAESGLKWVGKFGGN